MLYIICSKNKEGHIKQVRDWLLKCIRFIMSDKQLKKDGPPNIIVDNPNDDLEFEEGHESDTLLKKKGSTPANYGSLRPNNGNLLESTAESAE